MALSFPHLGDRFGLPTDPALIIFEACLKQVQVQILKRGHLWKRYQEVASREPDRCLNSTFLPSSSTLAEVAFKQVIRAKGDERLVLSTAFPLRHDLDGSGKVIVTDAPGHAPEVIERADVTIEEALLFLAGKSHHETTATMR